LGKSGFHILLNCNCHATRTGSKGFRVVISDETGFPRLLPNCRATRAGSGRFRAFPLDPKGFSVVISGQITGLVNVITGLRKAGKSIGKSIGKDEVNAAESAAETVLDYLYTHTSSLSSPKLYPTPSQIFYTLAQPRPTNSNGQSGPWI
ncbi:7832_t:CDS:2, partial [Paraglomus occultum]